MHKVSAPLVLLVGLLLGLNLQWPAARATFQDGAAPAFEFGLIGDVPYSAEGEAKLPALMAALNAANLAFVVHDGDIKSGSTLCSDETFGAIQAWFATSLHPLVYVLGDNEWTDCHRENNGSYDPLERLAVLRARFFPDANSLGQRPLGLTRQSEDPAYALFRENVRWTYGEVLFAGLHVVGSNNNLGRSEEADAEYAERNAATVLWLRQAFAQARADNSRGIMLVIQANPGFEQPPDRRTGFNDFLAALEEETVAFGKPVMLVHGDTHYFRLDKPLNSSTSGRMIENFTRLETFGVDDLHWVRVAVDYNDPNLFVIRQGIVPENLVAHGP